ncbi:MULTISPECIES: hypothetical protein [unclassified Burkholderia]|uniref:hypothetical protein n=1 Tax=unclassified Burkholderia TaxID=2613784 RepID=UPI000F56C4FD|nr:MULTISPECIES: hypothetical protein [unclassified Burkholderia]RQR87704.1 hypothetical protein DIE10_06355 [Burkholderia sp. Bp9011]RQR97048.1 hypothetical protein DIE09_06530 [Burkholderia sp. Bp9010]
MSEIQATFSGELQLAGWSETHNGGCKVTFWLPEASDLDAFRALTVRKGNTAGHRFMAALVEVGDDEQPVQRDTAATGNNAAKGGALARLAAQLCQDPQFHEFVADTYGVAWRINHAEEDITHWLREQCGIESRAELDSNEEAAEFFHTHIRKPWLAWKQKRGTA